MTGLSTPPNPLEEDSRPPATLWFWVLVALAFAYRATLIHVFPVLYSWDAFTRLLDPSRILVRHWMPVPQLPIYLADLAGGDIAAVRLAYAAIGTAGAALVGWYSWKSQGARAGLVTLVIVSALPTFVIYSIVPYQEGSLVLFLFGFLCAWKRDPSEMSGLARGAAAASLTLACLCRYEAWIFAAVFATRPVMERRARDLWIFAPAALAIGWWIVTLPSIDTTNPMATVPLVDPADAASSTLAVLARTFWLSIEGMHYVGLPLAIVGAVVAYRRGGLIGRETLLFWIVICAFTLYRAIHSSLPTERMTLLPLVIAALYAPAGLFALVSLLDRFELDLRTQRWVPAAIVALLVLSFGITTKGALEHRKKRYYHERSVALFLEQLATAPEPRPRVGIVPRPIKSTWGETRLKAIFGHSMLLDPNDPNFVLGEEQVMAAGPTLDAIVAFDREKRRYQQMHPVEWLRLIQASEPIASARAR